MIPLTQLRGKRCAPISDVSDCYYKPSVSFFCGMLYSRVYAIELAQFKENRVCCSGFAIKLSRVKMWHAHGINDRTTQKIVSVYRVCTCEKSFFFPIEQIYRWRYALTKLYISCNWTTPFFGGVLLPFFFAIDLPQLWRCALAESFSDRNSPIMLVSAPVLFRFLWRNYPFFIQSKLLQAYRCTRAYCISVCSRIIAVERLKCFCRGMLLHSEKKNVFTIVTWDRATLWKMSFYWGCSSDHKQPSPPD